VIDRVFFIIIIITIIIIIIIIIIIYIFPPPSQPYAESQDKWSLSINYVFPSSLVNCSYGVFETVCIQFFTSTCDSGDWIGKSWLLCYCS
jgi:uncharacterized alpha/beta hydrolase family protein